MSNHFDPTNHNRQSKGAAGGHGGEFTEKRNSAPTATLTDELLADAPARPNAASVLTAEAIHEAHRTLSRTTSAIGRSYSLHSSYAEDMAQDAWVEILEHNERHGGVAERITQKALLNHIARTRATRYGGDVRFGLRTEDFAGRRKFREAELAFAAEHGRPMRPSEVEKLAEDVRLSFRAGNRPSIGFHKTRTQLSLDATYGDGDVETSIASTLVAEDDEIAFDETEDAAARALHAFENQHATKDDIRKELWPIVSIRVAGAPQVHRGSLDPSIAKAHKQSVTKAGGAHSIALRWLDGESTTEEDEALFAPFGDIDATERQKAVDVLTDNPRFADRLWASGLAAAQR